MRWLNAHELEKLIPARGEPQTFVLASDGDLVSALDVKPQLVSTEQGEPVPLNQWVGMIDGRLVVVQQERTQGKSAPHTVIVLIAHGTDAHGQGGWNTLRTLEALPQPIRSSRPLFIQSCSASRDHVVCRPNDSGWYDAVYRASSHAEAEELLSYLRSKDRWNERCFIGKLERRGEWRIVAREGTGERVVGAYPEVDSALRLACTLSDDSPDAVLFVKDAHQTPPSKKFRVARGKVQVG